MKLEVLRFSNSVDSTSGLLFLIENHCNDIDGSWDGRKFLAYTLEDEYRKEKNMEKQEYPKAPISLALELLVDIMKGIQNVLATFILGCFTFLMCLVLSKFLYIVVIPMSILQVVFWSETPKKTTKSRRTVL